MVVKYTWIPTGEIATVVFITELLTQLRNQRSRPGQGLTLSSSARRKIAGQDQQHQVCRTTNRGHHSQLGTSPYNHPKGPHEQLNQSITSTNTSIRSIQLAGLPLHRESLTRPTHANNFGFSSFRKMAQGTSAIRAKKEGPHRQHRQDRDLVFQISRQMRLKLSNVWQS